MAHPKVRTGTITVVVAVGQDIFGDLATCPPEWSRKSAIGTAKDMAMRYGPALARKKALRFRFEYVGGGNRNRWALQHWNIVIDYLTDEDGD